MQSAALASLHLTAAPEEQKYMLAFAVNGCFGTIVAWQEAGFQPPAAEIARITLAGHPRCEGADVSKASFLACLAFWGKTGYNIVYKHARLTGLMKESFTMGFDFLKKSAEPAAPAAPAFPVTLAADAKGTVVAMENIPDEVFAQGILGKCCGIDPTEGKIYAPADGEITQAPRQRPRAGHHDHCRC